MIHQQKREPEQYRLSFFANYVSHFCYKILNNVRARLKSHFGFFYPLKRNYFCSRFTRVLLKSPWKPVTVLEV